MSDPTLTSPSEPDHPTATVAGSGAPAVGGDTPTPPPGYELRSLIGSGGMGCVYRAAHLSLTRDVAIKFLQIRYAPDSVTAWRFVEEARITARLQHPGIPPVHEVGTLPDGRPYLAMKLIKGHTLKELLKTRANPTLDGPDCLQAGPSGEDRGRFVGVFEQIAQAVGFAHSRRIIHRDLKPANVMVGDFGEVQVMDWGLAKELVDGAPATPTRNDETLSVELRLAREGGEVTQAGSLLGTPAYMPPEQAIGAIDQIDERSDVFGLGAILCVILTGKPPFVADSAEATRQFAARGKLDDALTRLDNCQAEPELIALAKRCLSPEAADRPANAGEVASAIATFRADAERRARQAELDRATAQVKAAEARKRLRVQRALATAIVGFFALAGLAAWWVDSVRAARRADRQAEELKHEADRKEREAELKTRQLVTERDVSAALNEVQVLREQGWKQAEDLPRWALTLVAARSALKRGEGLLAAGEPTDELRVRVGVSAAGIERDERDRILLAELDRIGEENDIRFMIPIALSRGPSERYAAAFRVHGMDLATAPHAEAVAWLKGHRFRDRLTAAVRTWRLALPPYENVLVFTRIQFAQAASAIGGGAARVALTPQPLRDRLDTILDAVTENPFPREWWAALARHDSATLKRLLVRPELERMSSRELSSLAEGLVDFQHGNSEVLPDFLRAAYTRFPGEFWVNFRLAAIAESNSKGNKADALRYLNAAVAARPRSAIARAALGAELWEQQKGNPTALRIVRGAADIDPTSPWPHFFLAMIATESENFADALRAYEEAVKADPDTGFLLAHTFLFMMSDIRGRSHPPEAAVVQSLDKMVASHPNHPGGYQLRAEFLLKIDNGRAALADFRLAKAHMSPDYPQRMLIESQLETLERLARWEGKLPAVLRREIRPANAAEFAELAEYCAKFEKKFALAARFATEAVAADSGLKKNWMKINEFAAWAIQAAAGKGTDTADLTTAERSQLRRQALAWLRGANTHPLQFLAIQTRANPNFASVRDAKELAKLPPEERAEWETFWSEAEASISPKPKPNAIAPPPRPIK